MKHLIITVIMLCFVNVNAQKLTEQQIIQEAQSKGEKLVSDISRQMKIFSFINIEEYRTNTPKAEFWNYKQYIYFKSQLLEFDDKVKNIEIVGTITNQKKYQPTKNRFHYVFQINTTDNEPITIYLDSYQILTIIKDGFLYKIQLVKE